MDHGDALRALDIGADAVVVSNHGGRQLDGAPSSIQVCVVCGGGEEGGRRGEGRGGGNVFRSIHMLLLKVL
jgi:hypothetical protein